MVSDPQEISQKKKSRQKRTLRGKILLTLQVLLIFIIVLCGAGLIYQELSSRHDASIYQAPGQLIDVGGYRLHIHCTGQGKTTVILDAGVGNSSLSWSKVQPKLASTMRVCSYDRAGYGWSESGPSPRSAQKMVQELHTLLQKANIPGPYILVGHSFGGLTMRLYTATYPHDVTGLVLVDSMHEDQFVRLPQIKPDDSKNQWLVYLGVARMLKAFDQGIEKFYDPSVQAVLKAHMYQTNFVNTVVAEENGFDETFAQLRRTRGHSTLPNLPLMLLTHGRQDEEKHIYDTWQTLQKDLLHLSSHSKQNMLKDSGHNIPLEQPDSVVDAIQWTFTHSNISS